MKKYFFSILLAVLFAAPAFASGPWGKNGQANPLNPNGTYMGSISGKNIAGSVRFTSTSSGLVTVSSSSQWIVTSGTGAFAHAQAVWVIKNTVTSATGFANIFMMGTIANASLTTAVDIYGRTVSGQIEGGIISTQSLVRPSDSTTWTVTNPLYFIGSFDGKLSKNWAANSFTAGGTLTVTSVDIPGFYAALANPATAATAAPQLSSAPVAIKITGVKISDSTTVYTPTTGYTYPTIQ